MSNCPENLLIETRTRSWNGVSVDLTDYCCEGRVLHRLPHEEKTRLGVILEEVGRSRVEPRLKANTPCAIDPKPRDMHFNPAGMELWGYSPDVRFVKDIQLSFDATPLQERLEIAQGVSLADIPRVRFTDDRVWTLVKLLAGAVEDSDPSAQLYGDSLIMAIAVLLLDQTKSAVKPSSGLSQLQLRDAISFLDAKLPDRVDLATLAELAGLSQSHYSRAFKASTGLAPYQWQLQARIERAKGLLLDTSGSLEDIAEATGFADAVHFGRTFRKLTGATPAAWRTDRFT
jgi:AraC family transcriptional regulator